MFCLFSKHVFFKYMKLLTIVTGGLNNLDTFFNNDLDVFLIRRRNNSRQKCQVDAKRFIGHGAAESNFVTKSFRCRLSQSSEQTYISWFSLCLIYLCNYIIPRPPALETAEARALIPTYCIPPTHELIHAKRTGIQCL